MKPMNFKPNRMVTLSIAAFFATALAGCGSSSPPSGGSTNGTTAGPLAPGGASSVFVLSGPTNGNGNDTVLQFPAASTGSLTPTSTLILPATLLVESMITDSNGKIYVAGATGNGSGYGVILVYAAGSTGNASPIQTISRPTNTYADIFGAMAVDSAGNLYVYDSNYSFTGNNSQNFIIDVFPAGANGVSTPTRQITGALTQLSSINALAVDVVGNLFVNVISNSQSTLVGSILEFASGANGNVAPTRVITNSTSTLAGLVGLAIDSSDNIYTSVYGETTSGSTITITGQILEFASSANGAANPIKTISGSSTGIYAVENLCRDTAGNLYASNLTVNSSYTPTVNFLAFGPAASGNAAPAINATSASWTDGNGTIGIH